MSEKYFDAWNDIKKKIDAYQKIPEPREGEVWFCFARLVLMSGASKTESIEILSAQF